VNTGRPSTPPEQLPAAVLLQSVYSVRRATLLREQLHHHVPFRWLVNLTMDDPVCGLQQESRPVAERRRGQARLLRCPRAHGVVSDEHVTVDGPPIDVRGLPEGVQRKAGKTDGQGATVS